MDGGMQMSTLIRAKISISNPYYLDKHRYYELKHFVMQYPFHNDIYLEMVKQSAKETDEIIGPLILQAVVNDWSYDKLRARENVPCCKETYYELYRRFFYILSSHKK